MRPRPGRPDRSDFTLSEAEELYDTARPRPGRSDRSDFILPEAEELCEVAEPRLYKPDRLKLLPKPRLYKTARSEPDFNLSKTELAENSYFWT